MRLLAALAFAALRLSAQEQFSGSHDIDEAINEAVRADKIPGAVAWIDSSGKILHRKAYGSRALTPGREAMTMDTIFDAASLTKVVSTTASVMKLFEQGKIRMNDKVTDYLPEFQHGKSAITVRQLMTHFSGLRPDLDLRPPWSGYETGIRKALFDKPANEPGEKFVYSDINFILLGEIVHRLTGRMLNDYARNEVFLPLGMTDTQYLPPANLRPRIAPTERYPGMAAPLRGIVHDETTRFMGGVAGHAGVFTTAHDLARFATMILNGGTIDGYRFVSPLTIRKFTEPQTPADQPILRGFGFDIDSPFSGNRGELFPIGSVGHTGFTGTSVWIDPTSKTFVILLTNSVHPQRRAPITSLRGRVATIAAAAVGIEFPGTALTGYNETMAGVHRTVARNGKVMTGLDVLEAEAFGRLRGKRVGLITNQTGLTADGRRNVDAMRAGGVNLVALFSPEHGIFGKEDREDVSDARDEGTGIRIFSLYKTASRRPTAEMLAGLDVLVFDIQDIGARFYTYPSTMRNAMEAAAKAGLPFMVLDRPNPITGTHVDGPVLDVELESFVGIHPVPVRHGMTIGELAEMINGERNLGLRLDVVRMKGWERGDWFDSTGLTWIDPSPNMRSLNAALLYPGVAMLEYSRNYSVGRGTGAPFEQIGAEFINGRELAAYLNNRKIPGIRFYPAIFTPDDSNLKGKRLNGVRMTVTGREQFDAGRLGIEIAAALAKLYPGKVDLKVNEKLVGNRAAIRLIVAGEDPRSIFTQQQESIDRFLERRRQFLLY